MIDNDQGINGSPNQNNDQGNTSAEYLRRADQACTSGDAVLGLHLYLAAFEKSVRTSYVPEDAAIEGLRQAWKLAIKLKERSLAEYIFEKLEPYLDAEEISESAEQLQKLALDKLEEFGLTREDLEDMTDYISQDFFGFGPLPGFLKVEHRQEGTPEKEAEAPFGGTDLIPVSQNPDDALEEAPDSTKYTEVMERLTYRDIVGYHDAIKVMNSFGVGMQDDEQFQAFVNDLNQQHGLKKMPIIDTYLFQAPVREDANQFMAATLGEIGLPAIRMHMEENLQGMPVLCVMAQADNQPKLNAARNAFEGGGVLVLEDIDLWGSPMAEAAGEMPGFMIAQLSRGAREAINLIRSAVENSEVYVLASSSSSSAIDPFFGDLLDPVTVIDIDYPTPEERVELWQRIVADHPSMQLIDRASLIKLSARMPRFDIYMAAREAVEDAYKASLVARKYQPVTSEMMFEKLAAYQPLDSEEYRQLEEAVVKDFRKGLASVENLINGKGE